MLAARITLAHLSVSSAMNLPKPVGDSANTVPPNSLEVVGGILQRRNNASGSLATFTSRTILPASSTMQMLVSLTETSSPAKWSMLRFSFCCLRPRSRTSFHHQPEAQHPKSSAIHKLPADYPIFCPRKRPNNGHRWTSQKCQLQTCSAAIDVGSGIPCALPRTYFWPLGLAKNSYLAGPFGIPPPDGWKG